MLANRALRMFWVGRPSSSFVRFTSSIKDQYNDLLHQYDKKAKEGDAESQLVYGVLLCEFASKLYDAEISKFSSSHFQFHEKGVVSHPSVTKEDIQQLSSKPAFLKWVRKEKNRLLSKGESQESRDIPRIIEADQHIKNAYHWFYKSAQQSQPLSMYLIGSFLYDKLIDWNSYEAMRDNALLNAPLRSTSPLEEGYKWLWRSSLGNVSFDEAGIPPKPWTKESKEKRCPLAFYDLGVIHFKGEPLLQIKPSIPTSSELFTIAGEEYELGDAFFWLGFQQWENDWSKVPPEDRQNHSAILNMQKAAALGNSESMFFLSVAYYSGILFHQDYQKKAAEWMEKAAEQGNQRALHSLGDWHVQGGAPFHSVNYEKAFRYYSRATAADSDTCYEYSPVEQSNSFCSLGVLYLQGLGTHRSEMKAFENYQRAAALGNPQACLNLADMLSKGIGVGKNLKSAKRYELMAKELMENAQQPK